MKQFTKDFQILIKTEWKILLSRFGIFILGWFLFTLSIALYTPTSVGASQIDFTIFNFLGAFSKGGINPDGTIDLASYSSYLLIFYSIMMVITVVMGSINVTLDYKKNKNVQKIYWYILFVIGDIISLFIIPLGVQIQMLYINGSMFEGQTQNIEKILRFIVFIAAFLIYCVAIALMVYCGIMPGVYNSIAEEFRKLTKMSYQASRIIWDFLLIVPGVILLIAISWDADLKLAFLGNYLYFGTILFIFITGPLVGFMLKKLNKVFNISEKTKALYEKKEA
ncbi:SPE_1075/MLC_0560 family membrane protein [Spiroplasma endosymbiont of Panorpa germanica]|uniref:SPE_1075/MLC_0560 family membrane protein n=1 Tax=Spiroplasma endosymbiont of Panorpa germanica TaxID=3066314 RepID=UPI0030CCD393